MHTAHSPKTGRLSQTFGGGKGRENLSPQLIWNHPLMWFSVAMLRPCYGHDVNSALAQVQFRQSAFGGCNEAGLKLGIAYIHDILCCNQIESRLESLRCTQSCHIAMLHSMMVENSRRYPKAQPEVAATAVGLGAAFKFGFEGGKTKSK